MKTRPRLRAYARSVVAGGALLLLATLLASGTTLASDAETVTIDPATQAAWLHDHFCCEHAAELAEV